jgi:tetratricopeptide (TPR) repeat protein
MIKKEAHITLVIACLGLFGLLLFTRTTRKCLADAELQLNALEAQKELTMLCFTEGKLAEGQAGFEKLVADFSQSPYIAEAVDQIAAHCNSLKMYQQAREYYQYILENWPNDSFAIWAQTGSAMASISLEEDTAADTAIDELLADFNDHQYLQKAFFNIVAYSHWVGKYQRTKDLCQYVLTNWPDGDFALWAQMDLAASYAGLGQDQNALAATEKLLADFNDHPDLGWAIYVVGEQYCIQRQFAQAAAIWDQIAEEAPEFDFTRFANADHFVAMAQCYQELGQYQKIIEYYQRVVDDYPDYQYTWNALFLVGRNYQNLKKAGGISASEADAKTRAAYQQLLEQYPDCMAARPAQRWLSRN